jgi:hypothetical protein
MRSDNSTSTGNGIDRRSNTANLYTGIGRNRFFFLVFCVTSVLFVQRQLLILMKYNNTVKYGDYYNDVDRIKNERMMNKPTAVIKYHNHNQDRNNVLDVNNSLLLAARPHPISPYYPLPTIGIHHDENIDIDIGIDDVNNKTIINVTSIIADSNNKIVSSNSSSGSRINNLVVMVMTRNDSFERRQTIRSTWAKTAVKKMKKKEKKQQQPSSSSSLDSNNNNTYSERNKNNINDINNESRQPLVYFVVGDFCKIPPKYRGNDGGENPLCKVRDGELDPFLYSIEQEKYIQDYIIPNENKLRNEQNIYGDILIMDGPEVYSNLPKKLKAAYTFVDRYLPKSIRYIAKVDDDVFVRLNEFQNYIDVTFENNNNYNNNDPLQQPPPPPPIVAGDIRSGLRAATGGKWKEVSQFKQSGFYPTFPIGSAGYLVSRPIAEYISQYQDSLFDYQGEDASLGIWVNTMSRNRGNTNGGSGAKNVHQQQQQQRIQYTKIDGMKRTYVEEGYCKDQSVLVAGHDFNDTLLKKCQLFWDNEEKQKQKHKQ